MIKKKFYFHSYIFLNLFFKRNTCIFEIKMYSLVIKIIWLFRMIDNLISYPKKINVY